MKSKRLLLMLLLGLVGCHQISDYLGDYRRQATPTESYMPGDPMLDEYSQVSDKNIN